MNIPAVIEASLPGKVESLEAAMLQREQVEIPVNHRFAPGVYMREVFMPAGTIVLGHCHKTEHLNIILTGRATVMMDGVIHEIVGPCTIKSEIGVRKALYIHEDMRWATIHPTSETDLAKLEDELIIKSATYLTHQEDIAKLKQAAGLLGETSCPG